MRFLDYFKFHSKIVVRSFIGCAVVVLAVVKLVEYHDSYTRQKSSHHINTILSSLATEVAASKDYKDFQHMVEEDPAGSIEAFFTNPQAHEYLKLQRLLTAPNPENFKIETEKINDKLGSTLGLYQQVYDVLFEKRYRQRHKIKELYYTLLDKLPIKTKDLATTLQTEIVDLENYREFLLDSGVKDSYKNRADKYVGEAIRDLRGLYNEVKSSGEYAKKNYWQKTYNKITPELLLATSASYLNHTTNQQKNFYSLLIQFALIFGLGIFALVYIKNEKEYGLVKRRDNKINDLKSEIQLLQARRDMLETFTNIKDISLALVDEKDEILWTNKGFQELFQEGYLNETNWEKLRSRTIVSNSSRTGVRNSVKIKGKSAEDYLLKAGPFVSEGKEYRLIQISNASYHIENKTLHKEDAFNPYEIMEFIVEKLGHWSNVYEFEMAETNQLLAFYKMEEDIIKREMGALVASVIYFSKANKYRTKFYFDIETSHDGFSFKIKLDGVHLKTENVGESIELNGKRYVPLLDSFSKVEENLRDYDGRVVIKNLTSANGKQAEVQLIVKETPISRGQNYRLPYMSDGAGSYKNQ